MKWFEWKKKWKWKSCELEPTLDVERYEKKKMWIIIMKQRINDWDGWRAFSLGKTSFIPSNRLIHLWCNIHYIQILFIFFFFFPLQWTEMEYLQLNFPCLCCLFNIEWVNGMRMENMRRRKIAHTVHNWRCRHSEKAQISYFERNFIVC